MEKGNALWYKDAIIYQVHVQSFADSNGDGIGDFRGLTQKLDYIKELGVTAVWLLPFYPSPLKDGGYDIANYTGINPMYGNLGDFKRFLKEAHARGLRIITELVLNHTSSQHPWFRRARKAKSGTTFRDFYVWNETPEKYKEARIIFKDFEASNWSWDNEAQAYYWHRFYSHQPDLNFDNPEVHKALIKVLDFWFELGIDGMRLDAIPYLYQREGTNCENLPETHAFLKKLRAHLDNKFKDKMLLAEANQWTEDAVAYYGNGDECHMSFHFPLMPRLFMGLRMEDRFPVVDILEQTPRIPDNCQWALFLRNHDELTLEMVTDEERDYMYKTYARDPRQRVNLGIRRRLAPLLENDRKKMELLNAILLSLPGSPVVYYGDELGMGDNYYLGDRDGVRTPMQWSSDKNAGFSTANPQQLYLPVIIDPEYHYETINVENQERNLSSLLWWMRQLIGVRKKYRSFSRGSMKFIPNENSNVLAFTREYEDEKVLVIANLSRYPQLVALDLWEYKDLVPKEVFSQENFPPVREDNYNLSLGSYGYYWFTLNKQEEDFEALEPEELYEIKSTYHSWNTFQKDLIEELESKVLYNYIRNTRWYRGKASKVRSLKIKDFITVPNRTKLNSQVAIIEFAYTNSSSMTYFLPLSLAMEDKMFTIRNEFPKSIIANIDIRGENGIIFDSLYDEDFRHQLFSLLRGRKKLIGNKGTITFHTGTHFRSRIKNLDLPLDAELLKAEQSNSAILFEDVFMLKFYRGLEEGTNPEVEILKYLTEKKKFAYSPGFAGNIEYEPKRGTGMSLGILSDFVHHEDDAWTYSLGKLNHYFNNILSRKSELKDAPKISASLLDFKPGRVPEEIMTLTEPFFLEMMELLGKRTAEMHLALGSEVTDEDFEPESFSLLYQKALFQSFRGLIRKNIPLLRKQIKNLPDDLQEEAEKVSEMEKDMLDRLTEIKSRRIPSIKSRIHGDYHLGQVLFTGKDFMIIDFEGEPARTLSERQLKYCPLKDVAGMIRSFHYAVYSGLYRFDETREGNGISLEPWVEVWFRVVSGLFLNSYLENVRGAGIVPDLRDDLQVLLRFYLLEKAIYELGYELNNRPDWVNIPLKGISHLMDSFI